MKELDPVTPGELLPEEFLEPMRISQYRLAKATGVSAAIRQGAEVDAAKRRRLALTPGVLVPTCKVDPIVIVSLSLGAGIELIEKLLGVCPQPGGEHPRMGTHNVLLRLGDATYLEVIAINPAAPQPSRPRWFELDRLVAGSEPRLRCWVARTDDIRTSLSQASEYLGDAESMSRGALEWRISIPRDGSLPLGGAAPALIQWNASAHPAASMQDKACRLVKLELLHPEPARLNALLGSLKFAEPDGVLAVAEASTPALIAHIETPHGLRTIGTPEPSFERTSADHPGADSHVKRRAVSNGTQDGED